MLLIVLATAFAPAQAAAQSTAQGKTSDDTFWAVYLEGLDALDDGDFQTKLEMKLEYYLEGLGLLREAYAIQRRPQVNEDILNATAEILWTRGRIADRDKKYWIAYGLLTDAAKSRPDNFKAADRAYIAAVFDRHLATFILTDAVSGRVFFDSSPIVKDRVLKGFQAAVIADWPIVKAQFTEALRLEPGNANLKSLVALADSPELRTSRAQLREDRGVDLANQRIPQVFTIALLKTHMSYMNNQMIMKALTDILVGFQRARAA